MIKSKRITVIAIMLLVTGFMELFAGDGDRLTNRGTTSASFLEVGIGARSMGMGGAYVAVAEDAIAMYWNPAGLSRMSTASGVFEKVDWVTDVSFNFIAASVPLGNNIGSIGVFINTMNAPNQLVRTVQYPDGNGEEYSASSLALGLSFARNLTDRFSIGVNISVNEFGTNRPVAWLLILALYMMPGSRVCESEPASQILVPD